MVTTEELGLHRNLLQARNGTQVALQQHPLTDRDGTPVILPTSLNMGRQVRQNGHRRTGTIVDDRHRTDDGPPVDVQRRKMADRRSRYLGSGSLGPARLGHRSSHRPLVATA